MLQAVLHGKRRGMGTKPEFIDMAAAFSGTEDTLTATFFERLLYLPDQIVAECLLEPFGWIGEAEIAEAMFWPRLEDSDRSIEPDLVIQWQRPPLVLVVEAKRWDYANQQNSWQLAREFAAAHRHSGGRPVWLLAVGGIPDTRQDTVNSLRDGIVKQLAENTVGRYDGESPQLVAVAWWQMYLRVREILCSSANRHAGGLRLLEDLRNGLLLHGITVTSPIWLKDLSGPKWESVRGIGDGSARTLRPTRPLR